MRCPLDHEAMKRHENTWRSLRLVGFQKMDGEPTLELRDCAICKSTLAREVVEQRRAA